MSATDPLPEITVRASRVLCVTASAWGLPPPVGQDGRLLRRPAPAAAVRRRRHAHARLAHRLWPAAAAPDWPLSGLAW